MSTHRTGALGRYERNLSAREANSASLSVWLAWQMLDAHIPTIDHYVGRQTSCREVLTDTFVPKIPYWRDEKPEENSYIYTYMGCRNSLF